MTQNTSSRGVRSSLYWFQLLVVGFVLAIISLLAFVSPILAQSSPLHLLNYTGRLKDASDNPLPAANIDLVFAIYDGSNATTANQLWTESYTGVVVKRGYFNVKLGSQVPFPPTLDFSQQYYLGVAVNSDPEMVPLVPFTPVPYAFYAFNADHAHSAETASHAGTADYATTANFANQAGYATESGHAATASSAHWADYSGESNHALTSDQTATASTSHLADYALNIPGLTPLRLVGTDVNGQIITQELLQFVTSQTPALIISSDGSGGILLDFDFSKFPPDPAYATLAAQIETNRIEILNLKNQMVLNVYDIATIAAQVLSNSQNISSNTYDIATLAAGLKQLPADIIQNKIDNATEAAAIHNLQQITDQYGLDISTMSAQILLNQLNIATNTTQISQNQDDIATIASTLNNVVYHDDQGNATISGNFDIQQNLTVAGDVTISGHLNGTSTTFSGQIQADKGVFNALQDSYGKLGLPGQVLSINQAGLLEWQYASVSAGANLNIADKGTLLPNQPILNIIGDSYTLTNDASNSAIILNIAELGKIGSYLADTSSIRDGQIMIFDAIQQKFVPMYLADSSTATNSCVKQVEILIDAADVGVAQNISVERNKTQTRSAVEILKKQPPMINNDILIHDFLLSEANQYDFNSNYMNLDGQLYPKTDYLTNSIYQRNLDSEHNLYQTTINQSDYKQIQNLGLVPSSPETLYDYITRGLSDGIHNLVLSNGEVLPAEVYNFSNNVQYVSNPLLGDTSTDKTLILIYHGDLIIDTGVTMQPQVGKRGMLVYVKGNLTNNGTISMSARGVAAAGQEILLYKNFDGSFEKVPAMGAIGGARNLGNSGAVSIAGKAGIAGVNRQTGGGGGGGMAAKGGSGTRNSGAGATGTSYSGGPGGGGAAVTNWSGNMVGSDGGANGGAGGKGAPNWYCSAGGGAGNPGGAGTYYNLTGGVIGNPNGGTGTGGLLIVYTSGDLTNNSSIQANGVAGATATNTLAANTGQGPNAAGGGGSGGGSINLFSQGTYTNMGTVVAAGGAGGGASANGATAAPGGTAGAGSITTSNLSSNYYLFNDAGQIKTYNSGTGTFEVVPGGLTAGNLTQTEFSAYGITNLYNIAPTDWLQLSSTFEVLTSTYLTSPVFSFKAIPQDQLVTDRHNFTTGAIQQIINGSFTSNVSQYSSIKVVVSPDSGTTWYTSPDLVNWVALTNPLSAQVVLTNGIEATDFNNIIDDLLNLPNITDTETIRFAYAFSMNNLGDSAALDDLKISYLTYDSWMRAFNNIDYNYSYSTPQVLSVTFKTAGEYKVNITDTACTNNLGEGGVNLPDGNNIGDVLTWDGSSWIATPAATGSGALWVQGDFSQQMVAILPYVGIGTTDPQYALDVVGLARFGGLVDGLGSTGFEGQVLTMVGGKLTWATPSAQVDLTSIEYDLATLSGSVATIASTLDNVVYHDDQGNATISGHFDIQQNLTVAQDASIAGTAYFGSIRDAYGNLGGPEQVLVFDDTGKLKWVDARGFISSIPWQIQNNGANLPHRPVLNIIGDSYTLLDDATSSATILNISEKGKIGGYLADTTNIRDGQIMVFDSISQSFVPMFMGVTTATDSCNIQHEFNVANTPITKSILVDRVKDQNRPAVEVLKKVPPTVNTDVTIRTFNTADQAKYNYNSAFQAMDGTTYQKTIYQQYPSYVKDIGTVGTANDLLSLYQVSIDSSVFKQILSLQSTLGTGSLDQTGSLYGLIKGNYSDPTITPNGNYNLTLQNGQVIPIQLVHFTSDMTYTSSPTLGDTTTDGPMLVLYYHGDLTIGSGVTFTPQVRRKGMTIIVDGALTNHGTISMTARGANAAGQNIQLYRNNNGTYETVPAVGGGGTSLASICATTASWVGSNGTIGVHGSARSTGGGGTGSRWAYGANRCAIPGSGAAGTSYSGGAGGGGGVNGNSSSTGTATGGAGGANGGAGGNGGLWRGGGGNSTKQSGGGAGNNGGIGYQSVTNAAATTTGTATAAHYGQNGTGGLLNIYALAVNNFATITANGMAGGPANTDHSSPGGGSGGGSINIFSSGLNNSGTITAQGGSGGSGDQGPGGAGGNGSTTFTDISLNYYLFDDAGVVKYYEVNTDSFVVMPNNPIAANLTEADFTTFGAIDPADISDTALTSLGNNFTLLMATSQTDPNLTIRALPHPQLVVDSSSFDVSTIDQITGGILDYTQTGTGDLKLVVSIDNGNTWLTTLDTGVTWQQVGTSSALTAQTVINEGILASDFNNVFDDFLNIPHIRDNNQLRFAYAFDLNATNDTASLKDMKLSFITFPGWTRASHINTAGSGGDYNYQYTTPQVLEVTFLTPNEYKVNIIGSDCNGLGNGGSGTNLPDGSIPGQVLTWDGSSWIPTLPSPSATSAAQLWVNGNSLNQMSSLLPYVGIGTTDPQYALDVTGLVRFGGIIDGLGSAGLEGQVLSMVDGQLQWATPSAGFDPALLASLQQNDATLAGQIETNATNIIANTNDIAAQGLSIATLAASLADLIPATGNLSISDANNPALTVPAQIEILNLLGTSYSTLYNSVNHSLMLDLTELGNIGDYAANTVNIRDGQVMVFDSLTQSFIPMFLGVTSATDSCNIQHEFNITTAGTTEQILVDRNKPQNRPTVEVLKKGPPVLNNHYNLRNFNSSAANQYLYNSDYTTFSANDVRLKTSYTFSSTNLQSLGPVGTANELFHLYSAQIDPNLKTITALHAPATVGSLDQFGSLYGEIKANYADPVVTPNGNYNVTLQNGQVIPIQLVHFTSDTTYTTTPTLGDTTANGPMLVLYYHGDLTVSSGVTLTPQVRRKGMTIIADGTLTNHGTISMTARGATATGQQVQLYKNNDGSFEYVPAIGGAGRPSAAVAANTSADNIVAGVKGINGTGRAAGGGGRGVGVNNSNVACTLGGSGAATSYSGGAGGGAMRLKASGAACTNSGTGNSTGGAGGVAVAVSNTTTVGIWAGGGAGNPGGASAYHRIGNVGTAAQSGTGGLLNIYARSFNNNGTLSSRGMRGGGGPGNWGSTPSYRESLGGGGSGGGSINIFASEFQQLGSYNVTGGDAAGTGANILNTTWQLAGGAGGDGSFTTTNTSLNYYLFDDGGVLKYYDTTTDTFQVLPETQDATALTAQILVNRGQINPPDIPDTALATLSPGTRILYATTTSNPTITVTALPQTQLITDRRQTDISMMANITGGQIYSQTTPPANDNVRLVISIDNGTNWLTTHDGGLTWAPITDLSAYEVATNGMTPSEFNNIVDDFTLIPGFEDSQRVKFAYTLNQNGTSATDQATLENLEIIFDSFDSWNKALHNTDYTYAYSSPQVMQMTFKTTGEYKVNIIGSDCNGLTIPTLPDNARTGQTLVYDGTNWIATDSAVSAPPGTSIDISALNPLYYNDATIAGQLADLEARLATMSTGTTPNIMVNGIAPDSTGNITFTANDIDAYTKSETDQLIDEELTFEYLHAPINVTSTQTTAIGSTTARRVPSSVAIGKYMYIFGGYSSAPVNTAVRLDMTTGTIDTLANMPAALYSQAVVASPDGTHIYLLGGYSSAPVNTVYDYNVLNNSYTTLTALPGTLAATQAFWYQNEIVLIGGQTTSAATSRTAQILAYNPSTGVTNTWSVVLPVAVDVAAMARVNDLVYVFSGRNASNVSVNVGAIVDLAAQTVDTTTIPAIPTPIQRVAGVYVGGSRIALVSGMTGTSQIVDAIQYYYLGSNTWQSVVDTGVHRATSAYGQYHDTLTVVAGENPANTNIGSVVRVEFADNSRPVAYLRVGERYNFTATSFTDVNVKDAANNVILAGTTIPADTEVVALADTRVFLRDNLISEGSWIRRGDAGGPIQIGAIIPTTWTDDVVNKNGETWLKLNGQTVDPILYPVLANSFTVSQAIATPPMTSLTSPSPYVITESSAYYTTSQQRGWFAFDQAPGTDSTNIGWASSNTSFSGGNGNVWLTIDLNQPQTITSYTIRSRGTNFAVGNAPKSWILEGSADNSNWVTLDTQTNQTFTGNYQPISADISNTTAYRYYRVRFTQNGGAGFVLVGEIELYKDSGFNLPNYGQNAQGQYSYIKAAGYTNNGYTLPDGSAVGQTLVWNGNQWIATSSAGITGASAGIQSQMATLQFSSLSAQVSEIESTVSNLEQTLGFTEENSLDSIATKVDLLNQLSLDSYQIASSPAVYAAENQTVVLNLTDVVELEENGILIFNQPINFHDEVTFSGQTVFNPDTAGTITIPAGTHSAYYAFSQPLKFKPIVTLTPTQNTSPRHWLEQVNHEGFTVRINKTLGASDSALHFNWTAIQTNWGE